MTRRAQPSHSPELERALRTARAALGSDAAIARVRAGVLARAHAGDATPAGPAKPDAGVAALGKLLGALLLAAGGGAWLYLQPPPKTALEAAPRAAHVELRARGTRPALAPETRAPAEPVDIRPEPAPPSAATPSSAHAARRAARHTSRAPSPAAAAAPAPPPSTARCADPEAEVALITRAQAALGSQPRAALALLAAHEQRFACGLLSQERDALRIDAERTLGARELAERHAREFIARYPDAQEARALRLFLDASTARASDHKTASAPLLTP